MHQQAKTYFNWSSGKDASLALYYLKKNKKFNIEKLITTVNSYYNRVSMHGLRRELLMEQAHKAGIPLKTIALPKNPSMEVYNETMRKELKELKNEGFTHCGFGDIFLEDLRSYRERQLEPYEIVSLYPLWKRDTTEIIREFLELGFKAIVICINADLLDEYFVGREIDASFLEDLPENVDPCGENGEFHTFCYDGPIFSGPVAFEKGEKTYREYPSPSKDREQTNEKTVGFWFQDLQLKL